MSDYKVGLWNAPSYTVSGIPWVSSSLTIPNNTEEPLKIEFPYVTKNFVVRNDGPTTIRLGFSSAGIKGTITNNYITLTTGVSFEADYKVSCLYLMSNSGVGSTGSVIAGMTAIESSNVNTNWSGSIFGAGIG